MTQKTYTKEEKKKMNEKNLDEYSKKRNHAIKTDIFWERYARKRNKINALHEPETEKCEKCGRELE